MVDCHVHIERGLYTIDWINTFIKYAMRRNIHELYFLEHTHRFYEFEPFYKEMIKHSEYQRQWFLKKKKERKKQTINKSIS